MGYDFVWRVVEWSSGMCCPVLLCLVVSCLVLSCLVFSFLVEWSGLLHLFKGCGVVLCCVVCVVQCVEVREVELCNEVLCGVSILELCLFTLTRMLLM